MSRKKHFAKPDKEPPSDRPRTVNDLSPEEQANIVMGLANDPEGTMERIAKAEGMDWRVVRNFIKRLRTRATGTVEFARQLTARERIEKINERIDIALEFMDETAFAGADLKDIAIAFGILVEKRELLSGRPTQIFSFDERKQLKDLLGPALREAQRRGMVVDETAVVISEEAVPRVHRQSVMVEDETAYRTQRLQDRLPSAENS